MKKTTLHTLLPAIAGLLLICITGGCGGGKKSHHPINEAALGAVTPALHRMALDGVAGSFDAIISTAIPRDMSPGRHDRLMAILDGSDTVRALNPYEIHYDSMPPGGRKLKINALGGTLGRVFNDSNKFHIAAAESIGIKPLHSLTQAWAEAPKLRRLQSCQAYYLDNLTHSLPYLVPEAHNLLTDIGNAFRDSLEARGGGYYRIKVTSVLRTPSLVKRLRRRNRNAVDTSAHLFGTTFDISYLKFICDTPSIPRTQEDLKNLLGEVVEDQRRNGRCYVKYERKQSCYHITTRK